jgi:hypothetical protein
MVTVAAAAPATAMAGPSEVVVAGEADSGDSGEASLLAGGGEGAAGTAVGVLLGAPGSERMSCSNMS